MHTMSCLIISALSPNMAMMAMMAKVEVCSGMWKNGIWKYHFRSEVQVHSRNFDSGLE